MEVVCIKVPAPRTPGRRIYDAFPDDPAAKRQKWLQHCLGVTGRYTGRPKCDGGWYLVPEVKAGSMFANPYPLKQYSLPDSLSLYERYLNARLEASEARQLFPLFPSSVQHLLDTCYAKQKPSKARSVAHYRLDIVGRAFSEAILDLSGCNLGCWCEDTRHCHAQVRRLVACMTRLV